MGEPNELGRVAAVISSSRLAAAIDDLRSATAGLACAHAALRNTRITMERSGLLANTKAAHILQRRVP
jgi:hypothetical protein